MAYPHAAAAFIGLLVVFGAIRIVGVFMVSISWDEFALLDRAIITADTGELIGGGRPGLGTLVLVPFAAECRNAVVAITEARLLWTVMVAAAGVAFWFLLRQVLQRSPVRWIALATGLGLWMFASPFLYSSNQVRTDQPAILFGLVGGIAFLASRRALSLALIAGLLFALGFLFSQKLLYVGGLVTILAVGQLAIRGEWRPRREMIRVAFAGAAFLAVLFVYRAWMGVEAPGMLPLSGGLSFFEFYREIYGWTFYRRMVPFLVPQLLIIAFLIALTVAWVRRPGRHGAEIITAWAVTAAGLAVLLFHAGRFSYFYMVLGLFPATVGALISGPTLHLLRTLGGRSTFLGVIWLPLVFLGVLGASTLVIPDLPHQRASLEFVERSFPPEARGFEGHAAFACRRDPDPFEVMFASTILARFGGEDRNTRVEEFIAEFRVRPVSFMVLPVGQQYPTELWDFWRTRYVAYNAAVHVPGRQASGGPGWSTKFEVIIPGEYMWRTTAQGAGPLQVGDHTLGPGSSVVLDEPGYYPLRLPQGGEGMFVIALPEPPSPGSPRFYRGH